MNLSTSAIKPLAMVVNSTSQFFNNIELFSGTHVYHVIRISSLLTYFFVATRFSLALTESLLRGFDPEYNNHVFIISSSKIIITLIISLGISIIYFKHLSELMGILTVLCSSELFMVMPNIPLYALYDADNLKKTLRYYSRYRYLLLFKFLNLMFVVFLLIFNVLICKNLGRKNVEYAALICIGSLCILSMICKYEKTVIIAVIACYDWDEQKTPVSLKAMLSTMITIGKYHLGTIFISILPIRDYYLLRLRGDNFENYESIAQSCNKPYFVSHILEHTTMVTAIGGQNFGDAVDEAFSLEAVGPLKCCTNKSKPILAWKNTSRLFPIATSLTVLSCCFLEALDVDTLSFIIVAVVHYAATAGLYCCMFSVINTVEHTIEFDRVKKKRNEIAHNKDLFDATKYGV